MGVGERGRWGWTGGRATCACASPVLRPAGARMVWFARLKKGSIAPCQMTRLTATHVRELTMIGGQHGHRVVPVVPHVRRLGCIPHLHAAHVARALSRPLPDGQGESV